MESSGRNTFFDQHGYRLSTEGHNGSARPRTDEVANQGALASPCVPPESQVRFGWLIPPVLDLFESVLLIRAEIKCGHSSSTVRNPLPPHALHGSLSWDPLMPLQSSQTRAG